MVHLNRDGRIERPSSNHRPAEQASAPLNDLRRELEGRVQMLAAAEGDERTRLAVVDEVRQTSAAMVRTLLALTEKLASIESLVTEVRDVVTSQRPTKEWYTVGELAQTLGKAEFTVREWCRLGRVHADKRACGRGNSQEWVVSHGELVRIQNHGLLPD